MEENDEAQIETVDIGELTLSGDDPGTISSEEEEIAVFQLNYEVSKENVVRGKRINRRKPPTPFTYEASYVKANKRISRKSKKVRKNPCCPTNAQLPSSHLKLTINKKRRRRNLKVKSNSMNMIMAPELSTTFPRDLRDECKKYIGTPETLKTTAVVKNTCTRKQKSSLGQVTKLLSQCDFTSKYEHRFQNYCQEQACLPDREKITFTDSRKVSHDSNAFRRSSNAPKLLPQQAFHWSNNLGLSEQSFEGGANDARTRQKKTPRDNIGTNTSNCTNIDPYIDALNLQDVAKHNVSEIREEPKLTSDNFLEFSQTQDIFKEHSAQLEPEPEAVRDQRGPGIVIAQSDIPHFTGSSEFTATSTSNHQRSSKRKAFFSELKTNSFSIEAPPVTQLKRSGAFVISHQETLQGHNNKFRLTEPLTFGPTPTTGQHGNTALTNVAFEESTCPNSATDSSFRNLKMRQTPSISGSIATKDLPEECNSKSYALLDFSQTQDIFNVNSTQVEPQPEVESDQLKHKSTDGGVKSRMSHLIGPRNSTKLATAAQSTSLNEGVPLPALSALQLTANNMSSDFLPRRGDQSSNVILKQSIDNCFEEKSVLKAVAEQTSTPKALSQYQMLIRSLSPDVNKQWLTRTLLPKFTKKELSHFIKEANELSGDTIVMRHSDQKGHIVDKLADIICVHTLQHNDIKAMKFVSEKTAQEHTPLNGNDFEKASETSEFLNMFAESCINLSLTQDPLIIKSDISIPEKQQQTCSWMDWSSNDITTNNVEALNRLLRHIGPSLCEDCKFFNGCS